MSQYKKLNFRKKIETPAVRFIIATNEQSPVSLPPFTVSCKNPLFEIIFTRKAPLILSLARMWVPIRNTSIFWIELIQTNECRNGTIPVCNVGVRCLHSVSDLLIKLLDLLPNHLDRYRADVLSTTINLEM